MPHCVAVPQRLSHRSARRPQAGVFGGGFAEVFPMAGGGAEAGPVEEARGGEGSQDRQRGGEGLAQIGGDVSLHDGGL